MLVCVLLRSSLFGVAGVEQMRNSAFGSTYCADISDKTNLRPEQNAKLGADKKYAKHRRIYHKEGAEIVIK